ncbi:AsmA family protein [Dokdonella ginsengisoli]|uniref:AsmA family protein n=1 Tax=Dokdonella ginsengisoli TaxID=363846 RepID=A0ABV9QW27_9GAMM
MKRGHRIAAWIGGLLGLLLVALVVFVATFDWNRARPTINEKASAALGRPFAIDGDLSVRWRRDRERGDWLPGPVFTAKDLRIDNPEWAHEKHFAHLEQVEFRLSLLGLLAHRVSIPHVQLGRPTIHLEREGEKRNNWTFAFARDDGAPPSAWTLDLGDIGFDAGTITLRDPADRIDAAVEIEPLGQPIAFAEVMGEAAKSAEPSSTRANTQDFAFGFKARGSYNGAKVSGSGKTGGVLALRSAGRAFPLQADLRIGDVRIALAGSITDPRSPDAVDLRLRLAADSMAHLYPVIGVTLPDTPPFETDGHLKAVLQAGARMFTYDGFNGRVGGSDLHGTLTYAQVEPRPKLSGKLWSEKLQFADLGPLIGLDTGDRSKASDATPPGGKDAPRRPAGGKVLPNDPFRTDRWRAMDADVAFNGKRIVREGSLPLSDLQAHVILDAGALALAPLDFGFAGGKARSTVRLDGRKATMTGDIKLQARGLELRELFPKMKTMQDALGRLNVDATLSASGNSVAALLGSSNGEVRLLMSNGVVSRELMELAGLNVGNYVVVKLFGDQPVKINCAAADFAAKDGLLESRLAVFDTDNALINIDGSVNFASEALDLDITPHTKGLRIFSLRSPLYVKGTLGNPDVGVHTGKLLLRGGGAVALGVAAAPAAALLALIAPSNDKDVDPCAGILTQMRDKPRALPAKRQQASPAVR